MRSILLALVSLVSLSGCTATGVIGSATVTAPTPDGSEVAIGLARFDGERVFAYAFAKMTVGAQLSEQLGTDQWLAGPWVVEEGAGLYWRKGEGVINLREGDPLPAGAALLLTAAEMASLPFELPAVE